MSKAILRIIPTMQSLRLVSEAHKMIPKVKKKIDTKKQMGRFLKGTSRILVGIPLMKETATQVEAF